MKKAKRIIALGLTMCCLFTFSAMPAFAAAKSVTRSHMVFNLSNLIVKDFVAKDSFKINYDGKKVIGCTPSQSKYDMGSNMFQKGGIKCTKKTASVWTYQSVWKLNMKLMPKKLVPLAKVCAPEIVNIQKVGTILQATTTYEVKADGSLRKVKTTLKWFTSASKLINQVKKIVKL